MFFVSYCIVLFTSMIFFNVMFGKQFLLEANSCRHNKFSCCYFFFFYFLHWFLFSLSEPTPDIILPFQYQSKHRTGLILEFLWFGFAYIENIKIAHLNFGCGSFGIFILFFIINCNGVIDVIKCECNAMYATKKKSSFNDSGIFYWINFIQKRMHNL